MHYYDINREERHFGFLFLSALIAYPKFRAAMFELCPPGLNPEHFDIYAEAAIFRDYWKSLGDQNRYDVKMHEKRLDVLRAILEAMELDPALVQSEKVFWTGQIGKSKLWYPGKWDTKKIQAVENRAGIQERRLKRCRWLCNAKPDVMICSGKNVLFIEIKVESGMGFNDYGYDQEETQEDIIKVGKRVIDWMEDATVSRINLTHDKTLPGFTWDSVVEILKQTRPKNDKGAEMIERHLVSMLERQKARATIT